MQLISYTAPARKKWASSSLHSPLTLPGASSSSWPWASSSSSVLGRSLASSFSSSSSSSSSSASSSSSRNKGNQKIQPKEANDAPLLKTGRSAIRAAVVDGEIAVPLASSVGWSGLLRGCSSNEPGWLPSSLEEQREGLGSLARSIGGIVSLGCTRSISALRKMRL